ncbi:hypothetical protein BDV40DRAFT_260005 [Aspergillus tamarii]|uniref:Uncharacterized protein n=1 Tax=Aspergillus tamarii TaxID=41984 RepID=A0A5N6V135_ASPTM|nr:hypothetical protein BDV40DRAFT_260005 [Aspergillus tamarii]
MWISCGVMIHPWNIPFLPWKLFVFYFGIYSMTNVSPVLINGNLHSGLLSLECL